MEKKLPLWIYVILILSLLAFVAYPRITGMVVSEEFKPTAVADNVIYKGGGFELYSYNVKKLSSDEWLLEVQGKLTRWIKIIDKSLILEIQAWDCNDQYSLVHRSSNTVNSDGLFTLKVKFTAPTKGKLRILLHSSGASIDTGYNLGNGILIKEWSSKLLKEIKEADVC
ncbi:hypothetical protein KY342_03040 [Candidatus Woesearchaeota archaeon]|nr:hypothetical protein [Candidatus Woesearchaeota archaeon]